MVFYIILACLVYFLFLILALHLGNNVEFLTSRLFRLLGIPVIKAPYRDSLDRIDWTACIQSTLILFVALTTLYTLSLF